MSGTGPLRSSIVADSLAKSRFSIRAQIIWAKERLVMSQGDYHWQHEPLLVCGPQEGLLDW